MTLRDKIEDVIFDKIYENFGYVCGRDAAADAILDVIREGVLPLEFEDWTSGHRTNSQAVTPFGEYTLLHRFFRDEHWQWHGPNDTSGRGKTIKAAKAAAQADYTRRILSALGIDQ